MVSRCFIRVGLCIAHQERFTDGSNSLFEDDDVSWDKSKRVIVDRLLPVKTFLGLFLRSAEDLEIPVHEAIFTEASRVICKHISDGSKLPIIEVWCCMEETVVREHHPPID